jgi:hypothetical protein
MECMLITINLDFRSILRLLIDPFLDFTPIPQLNDSGDYLPVEIHPCLSGFDEPFPTYSIILGMGFRILKGLFRDSSVFENDFEIV